MSKGLKIIFIISILLNFLLIGLTIGHFSKRAAYWGKMRTDINETIGSLPEEKKEMILGAMKELRRETRGTKREVDKLRRQILATLTAANFDAEKFRREALELHELHGVLSMDMAETVSGLAENLNQEEREVLSEFIHELRKHRRPVGPPGMRRPGPPGEGMRHPWPPGSPGERF